MSHLYTQNYTGDQIPFMFNSKNRTTGTIPNPTFTFDTTVKNIRRIIISHVGVPITYYWWNASKVFQVSKNSVTITYPPVVGNYDSTSFIQALQAVMNDANNYLFTLTFASNKFTFNSVAGATPIQLNATTAALAKLGFDPAPVGGYGPAFTLTGQNDVVFPVIFSGGGDNVFYTNFNGGGFTESITIPPGSYADSASIITVVNAALATIIPNFGTFSLSYSGISYFVTVSSTQTFNVLDCTGFRQLGFLAFNNNSLATTATGAANFNGLNHFVIKSSILTTKKAIKGSSYEGKSDDILFTLPITCDFGDILIVNPRYEVSNLTLGSNLNSIDFSLCDPEGALMELNGGEWDIGGYFEVE